MFRVGQKVVCIKNGLIVGQKNADALAILSMGAIYTVRWVGELPYEPWRGFGLGIRLVEIVRGDNETNPEWNDFPFLASRFRPIVERKTDISIFAKMLNPSLADMRELIREGAQ